MDKISDEHGNSTFKLTTRQVRPVHIPSKASADPADLPVPRYHQEASQARHAGHQPKLSRLYRRLR
jgi:hypothetical protein